MKLALTPLVKDALEVLWHGLPANPLRLGSVGARTRGGRRDWLGLSVLRGLVPLGLRGGGSLGDRGHVGQLLLGQRVSPVLRGGLLAVDGSGGLLLGLRG